MGKMKLIYFNTRGRAEISRLILAHAGEAYEDKRIDRSDWPAVKQSKSILIIFNRSTNRQKYFKK